MIYYFLNIIKVTPSEIIGLRKVEVVVFLALGGVPAEGPLQVFTGNIKGEDSCM